MVPIHEGRLILHNSANSAVSSAEWKSTFSLLPDNESVNGREYRGNGFGEKITKQNCFPFILSRPSAVLIRAQAQYDGRYVTITILVTWCDIVVRTIKCRFCSNGQNVGITMLAVLIFDYIILIYHSTWIDFTHCSCIQFSCTYWDFAILVLRCVVWTAWLQLL